MRSLVPRTDDLDQTLVDLLASPYMRYRGGVSPQIVQDVVARIDQFEGVSSDLASEVLLNGAFMRDVSKTDDLQERTKKIDNELIQGTERLHEKIKAISRAEAEQRDAARTAEAERISSKQEMEAAYARIHELEQTVDEHQIAEAELGRRLTEAEMHRRRAEDEANQRSQSSNEARKRLEARVSATERQLLEQRNAATIRARRNKTVRTISAVLLGSIAILGAALLLAFAVVTGVWPIIGLLLGALFLACLGIWIIAGKKRAWQIFVIVGVVIGILAGLQQLVEGAVGQEKKPTPATQQRL